MEEFDLPSLDTNTGPSNGGEKTKEQSEKQRESYKKAQAQIQRSQKDEKKAKGDNEQLFHILERFIQNPYYEELVPVVTDLLSRSVPSRYILSMIALFYPEATIHLLSSIGRPKDIDILLSIHREPESIQFDESSLHPTIRNWMSLWVQSSQLYITNAEMSIVLQNKLLYLLKEEQAIVGALTKSLLFFFSSRNINAEKNTMLLYSKHIIHEYITALDNLLYSSADRELIESGVIEDHIFFGLGDGDRSHS